jgi:hypothetical protein
MGAYPIKDVPGRSLGSWDAITVWARSKRVVVTGDSGPVSRSDRKVSARREAKRTARLGLYRRAHR